MHASAFDRYRVGTSPIHRLDPRIKVVVTVLFVLSNAVLPDGAWLAYLLSLALVVAVSLLAGLGPWFAVKRSLLALPFLLAALSVVFVLPGAPVATLHVGPWTLTATDAGLVRFASILARSLLSVQMAILLASTTPFHDLVHALRHLRMPRVLVATLAFMYRYLFVLSDEAMRLLRARDARSARGRDGAHGGALAWRATVAGNMAGQLFVRSLDRSDRVYNAMVARGYSGHLLTLRAHELRRGDWLAAATAVACVVVVQLVARAPWLASGR